MTPASSPTAGALSVSQVSDLIRRALEEGVQSPLRVVGEVGGMSLRNHWYFTLKDDAAVLSCVAWASSAARFGFVPKEGDQVLATGHVSHYGPQGKTQFYVNKLEPVGAGALAARFAAMCDELRRLGYFDEARKKPLPPFPRRIAVVTSRHGAALHDVLDTARRRCRAVEILVVDVRVQGDGAAEDVARAIRWLDRSADALGIDALLVTRGGGSIEDLWTFNERLVADAVYACTIPVVAAIGHESDTTVIELVADLRAATPTQATMRLIPDGDALGEQLAHLRARLELLTRRQIERDRQRLEALARHELLRRPEAILGRLAERVDLLARELRLALHHRLGAATRRVDQAALRLSESRPAKALEAAARRLALNRAGLLSAMRARLERARSRVEALERRRLALDPKSVLRRGFSLTRRQDGSLVRTWREVTPGELLHTEVAEGGFTSTVEGIDDRGGSGPV